MGDVTSWGMPEQVHDRDPVAGVDRGPDGDAGPEDADGGRRRDGAVRVGGLGGRRRLRRRGSACWAAWPPSRGRSLRRDGRRGRRRRRAAGRGSASRPRGPPPRRGRSRSASRRARARASRRGARGSRGRPAAGRASGRRAAGGRAWARRPRGRVARRAARPAARGSPAARPRTDRAGGPPGPDGAGRVAWAPDPRARRTRRANGTGDSACSTSTSSGMAVQAVQLAHEDGLEPAARLLVIRVRALGRLGDDLVHDAQRLLVEDAHPHRERGRRRLVGRAPQDARAALRAR